jgi:cell division transport system ATP-binding protein
MLADSPPAIVFSNVSKRYAGGREALKNVSLAIQPGEFVLVTGHSGAGKSTLLKLIAAIERASSGSVLVNGQNVTTLKSPGIPFLRRKLGLIFQDQKLLYDRSVLDNVMLPLLATGQSQRDAARRGRAALDKVGLLERERAKPVSLSGGEQQRLCIARAVINRPAILLADEPTASLDAEYAEIIMGMFHSFNQVGVTLVVATHDLSLVERWHPRVVALQRGALAA